VCALDAFPFHRRTGCGQGGKLGDSQLRPRLDFPRAGPAGVIDIAVPARAGGARIEPTPYGLKRKPVNTAARSGL
jgi:hypothetical protein